MNLPRSVAAMLAAMLAGFVLANVYPAVVYMLGLVPAKVVGGLWLWQLVTYMLLHGSLLHLLFNGLALYWFAPAIEASWGESRFLAFFILCGLGAALLTVAVQPASLIPTIGASGAIYGLLYAWARENPDAVVYMYGIVPMRARHLVILLFVMEFLLSYTPSPIARFAHLGGLLTAWLYFRVPDGLDRLIAWRQARGNFNEEAPDPQESPEEEINQILEKIIARGIDSLTSSERKKLDEASRKKRRL